MRAEDRRKGQAQTFELALFAYLTGRVNVEARVWEGETLVECLVADDGAGISADRLGKACDKLETDPDKKSGMGLGLAIVKQFVAAHGGRVFVASELGRGSTFRCMIPYSGVSTKVGRGSGAREKDHPHKLKVVTK